MLVWIFFVVDDLKNERKKKKSHLLCVSCTLSQSLEMSNFLPNITQRKDVDGMETETRARCLMCTHVLRAAGLLENTGHCIAKPRISKELKRRDLK